MWVIKVGVVIKGQQEGSLWWWECLCLVSILVVILSYSVTWGNPSKGYAGCLCAVSYNCMRIYILSKEFNYKRKKGRT